MSTMTNLFNAYTAEDPSPVAIKSAEWNYRHEQWLAEQAKQERLAVKVSTLSSLVSHGTVSERVKGQGYNLYIDKKDGETNKELENTTARIAKTLNQAADYGEIEINQKTFGSGRIYVDVKPNTTADKIFKNAMNG